MARVRCITMQKDEGLLLDAWLRYYGYLFGFENVEILDNGSSDPLTLAILEQFEAVGVLVHRQYDQVEHFETKGAIVGGIIDGWDRTYAYDFAMPCDVDEFLALFTAGGLCCRRGPMMAALDALIGCKQALWMETSLFNVPSQPGWVHPQVFPKGFLPSCSILSLDSGYHVPQSRLSEGTRRTDFTYLHYHNKPYELVQAHSRRKLSRRVDVNDSAALRAYAGAGAHMTKDLLMSRHAYARQFDNSITVQFEPFPALLRALGAGDAMLIGTRAAPGPATHGPAAPGSALDTANLRLPPSAKGPARHLAFDGAGYLQDHPDVAAATACGLSHYLYYGFQEGRALRCLEKPAERLAG